MSATQTAVQICNKALDHLGSTYNVESIETPRNISEKAFARSYDEERRLALADHGWNFASKRLVLPKLDEAPAFGYKEQYQKPPDFIRIISVNDQTVGDFKQEGDKILYKSEYNNYNSYPRFRIEDDFRLVYVYDLENPTLMEDFFIDYLSLRLAFRNFKRITGKDPEPHLEMRKEKSLQRAITIDGQSSQATVISGSNFLRSRGGFFDHRDYEVSGEDGI